MVRSLRFILYDFSSANAAETLIALEERHPDAFANLESYFRVIINAVNGFKPGFLKVIFVKSDIAFFGQFPKIAASLPKGYHAVEFQESPDQVGKMLMVLKNEIGEAARDAAMSAPVSRPIESAISTGPDYGGIDLSTSGMTWKIAKDGIGVQMDVDGAMIERVKREGIDSLSPVVLRVTPVVNIWPLIGLRGPVKASA